MRSELATDPVWGVKDPRFCRLLPLWQRFLAAEGVAASYAIIVRHPTEVAGSLQSRDGLPQWHGYRLWLDHNLLAEKYTRGQKRIFITYEQLLRDPKATLEQIRIQLDGQWVEWAIRAGSEAAEFVTPALATPRGCERTRAAAALPELVARAYRALEELAEGEGMVRWRLWMKFATP